MRAPEIDECGWPGESPEDRACRLACEKARAVALSAAPGSCIVAADTMVVLDETILGKPRDAAEAEQMLLSLAGRAHRVLTGYAILSPADSRTDCGVEESRVHMRAVSVAEARAYAASDEPMDKAGGYAAQGEGARFIEAIDGSHSNVIGLPLEAVLPLLSELGVPRR